jgi:tRNA dimethylallyltransferase
VTDRIRVVAIVGPTAVGKSALALEVARQLNAEIVSIDSMQLYRGMDIGTDKPTPEMLKRVPHHLVDVKDPSEDVTVAEFQLLARQAIESIAQRGRYPLLVGGSGLYFRAVVDDLKFPPTDSEIRLRLEEEVEALGAEALHERLAGLDPPAAERIEPSNVRRTVRALEVIEITGRRFSENVQWDNYESIYDLRAVGLTRPRDDLYLRIEQRVRDMIARGLIEEAKRVAAGTTSRTARMALGYRQVFDQLDAAGAEIQAEIVRATKRFARRQDSWFRSDPRIHWVDASVADRVMQVMYYLRAIERAG